MRIVQIIAHAVTPTKDGVCVLTVIWALVVKSISDSGHWIDC